MRKTTRFLGAAKAYLDMYSDARRKTGPPTGPVFSDIRFASVAVRVKLHPASRFRLPGSGIGLHFAGQSVLLNT